MFSFANPRFFAKWRVKTLVSCLLPALAAAAVPAHAQSSQDPIYTFHTNLGDMRVQLYPDVTPQTVANFVNYLNSGAYTSSFFHRSVAGFVIQGGGYTVDSNAHVSAIPTNAPVASEAHLSNTRGTIAMALSTGPNSGTNEWYFNEGDNSASLDGSNNGGPFTVFGKVADSASLAVMDSIGSLPIRNFNPPQQGGPFGQLPVENYNGGALKQSNFVVVTSITPPSSWRPVSVSASADGFTRILWENLDGTIALWKENTAGQVVSQQNYGPYSGWTAQSVATGRDGRSHLLWTRTDGTATIWTTDANGQWQNQQQYGPYSGWTAKGLAVEPDGSVRALWTSTGGTATVWTLDAGNTYLSQQDYGPYTGWSAKSLAVNPDGTERLLWTNTDGTAAFWKLSSASVWQSQQGYGPYTGFTAQAIASAPDGTGRVVWTATDAHIALWTIDANNAYTGQQQYGPYGGWYFQGISVGGDGNARLLWGNYSGQGALWSLTASGSFASNYQFGPF